MAATGQDVLEAAVVYRWLRESGHVQHMGRLQKDETCIAVDYWQKEKARPTTHHLHTYCLHVDILKGKDIHLYSAP